MILVLYKVVKLTILARENEKILGVWEQGKVKEKGRNTRGKSKKISV